MKTYREWKSGTIILDLGSGLKQAISFTLRPRYSQDITLDTQWIR
jgi:hypothetical protein